jgi:hypothetical protein
MGLRGEKDRPEESVTRELVSENDRAPVFLKGEGDESILV